MYEHFVNVANFDIVYTLKLYGVFWTLLSKTELAT